MDNLAVSKETFNVEGICERRVPVLTWQLNYKNQRSKVLRKAWFLVKIEDIWKQWQQQIRFFFFLKKKDRKQQVVIKGCNFTKCLRVAFQKKEDCESWITMITIHEWMEKAYKLIKNNQLALSSVWIEPKVKTELLGAPYQKWHLYSRIITLE